jgi:hypothetical protein
MDARCVLSSFTDVFLHHFRFMQKIVSDQKCLWISRVLCACYIPVRLILLELNRPRFMYIEKSANDKVLSVLLLLTLKTKYSPQHHVLKRDEEKWKAKQVASS